MNIKILGTGCPNCKRLEQNTRKAVEEMKIKATIVKVTEIDKIIGYGVISTPALVVNGEVKCYGRVPDVKEIEKLLW
ncbi:MAG: thioredoxin family protein [Candidatus Nanoarchaeia archaeon]